MTELYESIDPDTNYYDAILETMSSSQQSQYISVSEYNTLPSDNSNLTILSYNIRSFNQNKDALFSTFDSFHKFPNILHFSETWFNEQNVEEIGGFSSYHTFRSVGRSGGSSIYVKSEIPSKKIDRLCISNLDIEVCTIEAKIETTVFIIIGIYRPHSGTIENFSSTIESIITDPLVRNRICICLGDVNINMLAEDAHLSIFSQTMYSYHFVPTVTKATRFPVVSHQSPSLLDHIWLNDLRFEFTCGIIMTDITDHSPVYLKLKIQNPCQNSNEKVKISFRLKNPETQHYFHNLIASYDWSLLKDVNVNIYMNRFMEKCNEFYCKAFPLKTKYIPKKNFLKPWISGEIKKLICAKSQYMQLMRYGVVSVFENNRFKNRVKSIIVKSKKKYLHDYFDRNTSNIRNTWKMIRTVLSSNSEDKKFIKSILWNGLEYSGDVNVANAFNNYFSTIARDLEMSLPTTGADPLSFLNSSSPSSLYMRPVTNLECRNLISKLKNSTQDTNSISVGVLKLHAEIFSPIICDLINQSFLTGCFPDSLKIASILPIHKKNDPTNIENYRPISILPLLSKIFEKTMHTRLLDFLFRQGILSEHQFGFLPGRSTELAILELVERNYEALNKKLNSINIFIDFRRAFDTIDHGILLKKMEAYGVRGIALCLFKDYLSRRFQYVRINGSRSSFCRVHQGVPQGSVIGPLLFLLYINDITNTTE